MEDIVYFDKKEAKKNVVIKNILNVVDLAFEPEKRNSRVRDKVRKVVMDEINDYHRFILEIWP
jgi:hypothetical protein